VALAEKIHEHSNDCPTFLADRLGTQALGQKSSAQRKAAGLYLTPLEVAFFMAGQISPGRPSVRILEPAAGSGTLLCAAVEQLALTDKELREVEIVAYETDPELQSTLETAVDNLKCWAVKRRVSIHATVEKRDFILAQDQILGTTHELFHSRKTLPFDLVIANPPYFKIAKFDPRAQGATSVVRGQPNIYAIFMAAGATLLRDGGEFLFINAFKRDEARREPNTWTACGPRAHYAMGPRRPSEFLNSRKSSRIVLRD
jgi:adenine-specific DNA-methyltransferase